MSSDGKQLSQTKSSEIFDALARDLRSSLRTLRRYPGVTCLALLSLALGIGANTLAFSFVNVLLFHSLPYPNADRLVMSDDGLTPAECLALQEPHSDLFEETGCFTASSGASLADDNTGSLLPEHLLGQGFTAGMGRALAVRPLLGRWFSETDEAGSAGPVVLISHRLWQRRFAARSDILDQSIRMDGEITTIIGVMPDEFEFLNPNVDYWHPFSSRESPSQERMLGVVTRLSRNATVEQAQSVLDALIVRPVEGPSDKNKEPRIRFTRMVQYARTQFQDSALILQGTVAFVLLIACANVAGLLLTQAVSQQRELAVRSALGSGKGRIVRQVVVHSVLLFCAGGLLGLAAGWEGARLMVNVVFPFAVNAYGEPRGGMPRSLSEASVDGTVFLFTFALSVVCGLAAAIAPAMQVLRAQPLDVLRESTSNATAGLARQRLRSVFVSMQIALAFILLVGAALMLNGLTRAVNQDIGFATNNLLTARVQLPDVRNADPQRRFNSEQMRQNLASIAGVSSASAIAIFPPLSGAVNLPVEIEGRQSQTERRPQFLPVMPDYFKTLQVAIAQGREFEVGDGVDNLPVAIVNDAAARIFWPNESPLGKLVRIQSPLLPGEPSRQVIGVVTEVSQYSGQESRPQLYVPYSQLRLIKDEGLSSQLRDLTFVLRTPRPAPELASAIASAVGSADRNQAISSIRTMQQTAFAGPQRRGVFVSLIGLFGAIAVVLATIGIYGVMANVVSQRFNELGIRVALGANPGQIRRLVIRQGSILIGIGLFAGVVMSFALTRVLRSFLFGSSATDPLTFILGIGLLGGVALLACYIPARRASRVDAIVALRHY